MNRLILFLIVFSISAIRLHAAANYFQMTDIGSSAEMIGRGKIAGFSRAANGLFENPAALHRIDFMSVSLFTTTFMEEITYFSMAGAIKTPIGTFGAGSFIAGVPEIFSTFENSDKEILPQSTFKYQNVMLKAGYELSTLSYLHLGAAGIYYASGFTIENYRGKGYNIEAGGILDLGPLEVSAVGTNLIPFFKVNFESGGYEKLAAQLTLSGRYDLGIAELFGQGQKIWNKPGILKSAGLNVPMFWNLLNLSGGYKEFYSLNDILRTYTLGLGLHLSGLDFNYAYERSDNPFFNHKHYFSINVAFGGREPSMGVREVVTEDEDE